MADDRMVAELDRFLTERGDPLMRTAVLLTGSREAGQDLLQTAPERLLRHRRTLEGDPEAYLRRTLYNLAADGFRRQGRLRRKLLLLRAETQAPVDATAGVDLRDALVRIMLQLPPGEARDIGEKWVRSRWTLYVNPKTYLPVRLSGSGRTFGEPAPSTYSTAVTDMQWLPPTAANIAQSLVTIPAGFQQVSSPADQ